MLFTERYTFCAGGIVYDKKDIRKINISLIATKLGIDVSSEGNYHKARCPFHEDKKESFALYDNEEDNGPGIWKCFTEGIHGDSIDLVMRYNKMTFSEALNWIGENFKVERMPLTSEDKRNLYIKSITLPLLKKASLWFHDNLSAEHYEYLTKERGLARETIEEYKIGYTPKERFKLKQYLYNEGFDREALVLSGLFKEGESGIYPIYYDRIMFPHFDPSGKVIGFSGRAVSDNEEVKYITKNAEFSRKRDYIFGINYARQVDPEEVFIVEGILDVLTLRQETGKVGIAVLGASPDKRHLRMINAYLKPETIYLSIDGDKAGKKGTIRFIKNIFKDNNFSTSYPFDILCYPTPENHDIDSLLREEPERFFSLIEESIPVMDFYIDYYSEKFNLKSKDQTGKFVSLCMEAISSINNFSEYTYLEKVSEISGIEMKTLEKKFKVFKMSSLQFAVEENEKYVLKFLLDNSDSNKESFENVLGVSLQSLISNRGLEILDKDFSKYSTKIYYMSVLEVGEVAFEEALYYARIILSAKLYKIISEYKSLTKENRSLINKKTQNKIKNINILFSNNQKLLLRELS